MNTLSLSPRHHRALRGLALLSLAAGAWALSGIATQAQARDNVYWSIGVNSPGVHVGVSNAPTVVYSYPSYGYPVYSPRPVVVYPRPVVVHPHPVVVHSYPVYEHPRQWRHDRPPKHWHKHGYHKGYKHGYRDGRRGGWDD